MSHTLLADQRMASRVRCPRRHWTMTGLTLALALALLLFAVCTSVTTGAVAAATGTARSRARHSHAGGSASVSSQTALRRLLAGLSREQREALRRETSAANHQMAAKRATRPAATATAESGGTGAGASVGVGGGPDFSVIPAFVSGLMSCRGVSGLSVGIVQRGRVVYTEGFGMQSTAGEPVTADTLFGIGSCTKAFTASLGAILQQDGRFDLNRPVVDYVPEYRLIDQSVSSMVSATDLLTHRTGLASHDTALFLNTDKNRREKIMNARALTPQNPFRASFIYNNCQ